MTYDVFTSTRAVSHHHIRRARLWIVRPGTGIVHCTNCDRVNGVRVSVKVALVSMGSAISTREYKDTSFTSSALVDSVQYSLLDELGRTLHAPTIIWRSPRARIDRDFLVSVIQSCSLVDVADRAREDAYACYLGFVGNANTACSVLCSSNLASTTSSMMVVK